jgi:transposase
VALLTEAALAVPERFGVNFDECHNDSATISFYGSYRGASGRKIRGRTAPMITYGHSKDQRPDMKQPLFIPTMTADGNTSDSRTHIDTRNTVRALAGRSDFLYVADTKTLFSREHGPYRSRGWTVRRRVTPQSPGRRRVPPVDPDQHP